ncbi:MAG: hypothetical protein JJU27_09385 [Gammaproteobacteria bacterium]|nr:hypothetical protein [Gammaproteobacteria bacterium]
MTMPITLPAQERLLELERRVPLITVPREQPRITEIERLDVPQAANCAPEQGVIWSQEGQWSCMDLPAAQSGPGAKVWIGPNVQAGEGRPATRTIMYRTQTHVLNPGTSPASVRCINFFRNGTLDTEAGTNVTVSPGAQGYCRDRVGDGWMLIVSDRPVLPFSYTFHMSDNNARRATNPWYPVDCSRPEGYEFVCQFAR